MKSKRRILIGSLILLSLGAGSMWISSPSTQTATSETEKLSARIPSNDPKADSPFTEDPLLQAQTVSPTIAVAPNPGLGSEKQNLEDMAKTLYQFTRPETKIRDLVDYLQQTQQGPTVLTQANPATGEMAIVRTKSPLKGTRYFHAQYMQNESKEPFIQHMSFEYKPGPLAMAEAQTAIQNAFPNLGKPKIQKDDFIRWDLDEDYFVWVKKMGPQDLQDDPFNAYTADDIGTVRVAIEIEIHSDEESHH